MIENNYKRLNKVRRCIEIQTIKDISEKVGVSRTSIYNLIKKNNIQTFKREGKTYIDESGESLILAYYNTEQHESISDIISDTKSETEDEASQSDFQDEFQDSKLLEYTKVISILEDERSVKNNVIKELLQSNKILSQALAADKVNETARLMINDSMYAVSGNPREPNAPRGFFSRIFRKK